MILLVHQTRVVLDDGGRIGIVSGHLNFVRLVAAVPDESSDSAHTARGNAVGSLGTLSRHAAIVLSGGSPAGWPAAGAVERWAGAVRDAVAVLDMHATDVLPAVTMLGPDASSQRRREFVLLNYLHTHNNRLGVRPAHEAYLGYLGHHVVSGLAGTTPRGALVDTPLEALR